MSIISSINSFKEKILSEWNDFNYYYNCYQMHKYCEFFDKKTCHEHVIFFKDKEKTIIHRDDGPAIVFRHFDYKEWYKNGLLHREDGPAIINNIDGLYSYKGYKFTYSKGNHYFLNGKLYYEQNYWETVSKLRFEGFV